jgi:glutamine synthetase
VPEATQEDLSLLNPTQLKERGYTRLPGSLPEALNILEKSDKAKTWFGDQFVDVYLKHKAGEIEFLAGKTDEEVYQLYEEVY